MLEGLVPESTVYNVRNQGNAKTQSSLHLKETVHLEKNYSSGSRVRHEEAEIQTCNMS